MTAIQPEEHTGTVQKFVPPRLSAFVLTRNEEQNLEACLKSLAGWCTDIHVVDSFSTDRTLEIARKYQVHAHLHAFEGHTKQRTWALKNLPFENEWVIALDADHRVLPELRDELISLFTIPHRISKVSMLNGGRSSEADGCDSAATIRNTC